MWMADTVVVVVHSTEQWLELEVPPDAGNGAENAGLPLARLLWHLSPLALVGLIEALMLVCIHSVQMLLLLCCATPQIHGLLD